MNFQVPVPQVHNFITNGLKYKDWRELKVKQEKWLSINLTSKYTNLIILGEGVVWGGGGIYLINVELHLGNSRNEKSTLAQNVTHTWRFSSLAFISQYVNSATSHVVARRILFITAVNEVRGGAVGGDTALLARRTRVRFPVVSF